jgi:hypothetical protein
MRVLIVGYRNPVLADYATHCARAGRPATVVCAAELHHKIKGCRALHQAEQFSAARFVATVQDETINGVVLFLEPAPPAARQKLVDTVVEVIRAKPVQCVCVISTFRVHLGDRAATRVEAEVRQRLHDECKRLERVVILRPSHVVSRNSALGILLRNAWYWFPLVPSWAQGCSIDGNDLFAVIDQELSASEPRSTRTYTLLGPNRRWQTRLRESKSGAVMRAYAGLMAALPAVTVFRQVAGALIQMVVRRLQCLRAWHVTTLRPRSTPELLALYNKHNYRNVKVVGYNNGVVHFGQRHPGRTVVATVASGRRARVHGDVAVFDAGVTVRRALDVLRPAGREFYVLPNYSYVSVGTAFFIPIHGSSSKFNTMGQTVEQVLLYDPVRDHFVRASRGDAAFDATMYNLGAEVLLLRLRMKTREQCRYYVKKLCTSNFSAPAVLSYFHDTLPSNVEIRKAGSRADQIQVYQYYTERLAGENALEIPRDTIGRVWDRLEENPIASPLFHGLTRWLAYHVELFLSEAEFATFWETHQSLPLLKIQLRFIRRDGLPNSPFREHDCVSADLFMLKKHRHRFDSYLKEKLPAVKMNPGKHSM